MNKLLSTLLIALVLAWAGSALAQSSFHDTVVSYVVDSGAAVGGDFWFALPMNGIDEPGEYIHIYLSSPVKTTAYIQLGLSGPIDTVAVPDMEVATFNCPLSWEMQSSGVIENKAVHVWSDNPNIRAFFMSHDPYSSDGTYILPTSELGRDYIVAAFESDEAIYGDYENLPDAFTIAATEDNTRIEIIPTADLRQASVYPEYSQTITFPRGKKFVQFLNRGQSVQFIPINGFTPNAYDVSGTVIHSNEPIAVIGSSECPNIPAGYLYNDFVCHSNLPISSWGNTYYSTPFVQPDSMPLHDSSMFLIASSRDSQIILRYDCSSGDHIECFIDTALSIRWFEEAQPSEWYSNAPFMLVQYINSETYPDGNNGSGDPAEVALDPKENFTNSCLFIVADSAAPEAHYDNYANIFYNDNAANSTMLDGDSILKYSSTCLGDSMSVAVVPHINPGAHLVTSDSGVSVYIYGYGYDESYSWSGGMGYRPYVPFKPKDSIPPAITFTQNGNCILASLADSGSGISDIILDSSFNMSFTVDSTFVPDKGVARSFADLCDSGNSQFAYARFSVFDIVGNVSIATVTANSNSTVAEGSQTEVCATLNPNPAANSATLNFTLPQTSDVTFEISSMDGKTVFRWNGNNESEGEHVQTLDFSSLPTASYVYRFAANGQSISGKLIINR